MGNKVIAVEPNPIAFGFLHESKELNGYPIKIIHGAVSDYTGFTHIQLVAGNTGETHTANEGFEVRAYKPSGFLTRWPEFIKMDIEGDELKVLKGEPKLLEHAKVVVFETHAKQNPDEAKELLDLFMSHGFSCELLHDGAYQDWLAVRQ